ncbi:hypothetical protein HN51_008220 [Arachis hypogaea]|nr:ribonuclease MC [Arachis hypogaea]QHO42517.1 Ribonuclease [Arachis hypogaea]
MKSVFIIFYIMLITFLFRPTYSTYQYFKLSLQWPPSFQQRYGVRTIQKNFTIHGLWPQNFSGPWPHDCSLSHSFEANTVNILGRQLAIDWPNLHGQKWNNKFWEAQWLKHGTCSLNNFKQLQYFSLAIGIKNKLDILGMLENAGIRPNATITYNYIDIVDAIKAKIGPFEPELYCVMPHNNVVLLFEVRVCRDAMGATYISCVNNSNSCQGYLINIPE